MSTDMYGLARTIFKQIDLTIQAYNGLARDGELIIDLNPGPGQYQMYIGQANGVLTPTSSGGGGNTGYSDFAGVANLANFVPASGIIGTVANANFAAFAGVANRAVVANLANSVVGANVIGPVNISLVSYSVAGSNVVGAVANAVYANSANVTNRANIANIAYSVDGSNVVGPVALANVSTTVSGNAQPNITSVGTLISLQVTGNAIAGNIVSNGIMTATGNITGGNLLTGGIVNAAGNVSGGNITTTGNVVANLGIVSDTYTSRTGSMNFVATGTNQNITLDPSGTGFVDVSSARIVNLQSPTATSDAATKGYVDALAQGLTIKDSAKCATVADLGGTYNNGAAGVGATITLGVALTTIDGYTLVNGDRILVKNQANAAENGVYVRTSATVLTRATDSDTTIELQSGSFLFVENGTINAKAGFVQTTDVNTVGTDPCNYTQFSYAGTYSNGAGLDLVGTQFSVSDTTVTAGIYGSSELIPVFTVNSRGQLTAVSNVAVTAHAANLIGNTLSSNVLFSTLTTVGTLTGLTVAGAVDLGNVANLTLTGGNVDDVLLSDGAGGAVWQPVPTANRIAAGTSNITVNTSGNIVAGVAGVGGVFTITNTGIETGNADVGTIDVVDLSATGTTTVLDFITTGLVDLGAVANLTISGGSLGQVLTTDGNGTISWTTIVSQPAGNVGELQYNDAGALGGTTGITFGSGVLNFPAAANIAIADGTSGQYLKKGGSGLTWGGVTAGGANTYLQYNDQGNLAGTSEVRWTGAALTFANVANIKIPGGNAGDQLTTDGTGNVYWTASGAGNGVPGGSNQQIQFNNNGVFGGVTTVLWNGSKLSLGSNSQITITGGSAGQVLGTDGAGNLSWTTGGVTPGGTNTQVQFNDNGTLGGISTVLWDGVKLSLGSNADITITGGSAGQVLGTDGAGNLSWTAGGGTPGGANTQIQFNDNGVFGAVPFAVYDGVALTIGSNTDVKITGGNAGEILVTDGAGNLTWQPIAASAGGSNTQVQFNNGGILGGMSTVVWDGTNISLGNITTVKITGGNVGEYITTDGNGNISWASAPTPNRIVNGSSNVVVIANSNVTMGVSGVANVVQISSSNVLTTANINSAANITAVDLNANNNVNATVDVNAGGNVTAGNVFANTSVLATANVIANNVQANSNITANINLMAVANVIGGNVLSNLDISAGGNITANGNVQAVGNVQANGSVITDTITSRTGSIGIVATGVDQNITLDPSGLGYIDASTSRIKNVVDPVDAQDAASKFYVDAVAQGLKPKVPVVAATTAALGGTYNNGASGVGATLTFGAAITDIDGVTLAATDRILVKDQANDAENGIYEYTSGTVFTRTTDYDVAVEMPEGTSVFVQSGTINGTASFVQIGAVATVGTDAVTFVGFGKASQYSAGTGLTLVGTQFKLANTAVTPGTYGNTTHAASFTVDQQGRITAVSNALISANAETLTGTFLANNVINSNLTTLGILTALNVNGVSNLSANGNVKITGGVAGQALITDGTGNLSWGNVTSAGGVNTQVQFNDAGDLAGIPFATYDGNVLSLGSNANIIISGGSNGQVLGTDGAGNLSWLDTSLAVQPTIEFTAIANGNGQSFGNAGLANLAGNTKASVYVNGVLARVSDYTITGTNLVFNRMIQTGDEISVAPVAVVGVEPTTELTNGSSEVAVELNGNIVLTVAGTPNIGVFTGGGLAVVGNISATANLTVGGISTLGNVGNVKITGGSNGQVLTTDGNGNLTWANGGGGNTGGTPGGSNTQLQFNNAGVFGGISTATWNGNILSLGSNANIRITGGTANTYLKTDGTGNLTWSEAVPVEPQISLPASSWGFGRSHVYGSQIWRAGAGGTAVNSPIYGVGLSYNPDSSIELPLSGVPPASWTKIVQQNLNIFGLSNDGKFWAAGWGNIGSLGSNSSTSSNTMRIASSTKLTGTGITVLNFWSTQVYNANVDGAVTTYVHVNDNGNLRTYSIGDNSFNLRGGGGTSNDPFLMTQLNGKSIVDASVSPTDALFVTSTGEVWGLGSNGTGQLGIGNTTTPTVVTQATLANGSFVTNAAKVVTQAITGVGAMTYILLNNGQVLAAGLGADGRLCNGSASGNTNRFSPVQTGVGVNLTNIVKIMTHTNGFAALDNTGNLYFAGNNVDGIWGTGVAAGTAGNNYATIRQTDISNFWINTGFRIYNACFTLDSTEVNGHRTLWAAGNNSDYQLGVESSFDGATVITRERVPLPYGEYPVDIKLLGGVITGPVVTLGAHMVTNNNRYYVVGSPGANVGSVENATFIRWFHAINDFLR